MKARLLGATLVAVALAQGAAAQQPEDGDPAAGRELASRLCTGCHIVGTERVGSDAAPPFPAIARDPEITVTELHGWIGPRHPMLPNLALTPAQTADINAYLDSLRAGEPPAGAARPGTGEAPPVLGPSPPERIGPPIEPEAD